MEQVSPIGLEVYGITQTQDVYWNLATAALYEESIRREEGTIAHLGPLVVKTGKHTGRSAQDKFTVDEPTSTDHIWWGDINRPFSPSRFDEIQRRMCTYLQSKNIFVQDCWAGADTDYRVPIRIITEYAWHSLFARNMFVQATPEELTVHEPEFTVISCPGFLAIPEADETNSEVFILVNFAKKLVLIGGTSYAGEIKKSIFTIMNYLLPFQNILPMHCSANYGPLEDTALFFGLSGTGKTTLSADDSRTLIGDDEHGWSDEGIFNFEGGCYAKMIRLSAEAEPQIYETARKFGTVLENVTIDEVDRRLDFDDATLTENTRGAYPITHIANATRSGQGGHPKNIIFLTADAFGVLPPIAKLTSEQAMYHFLSGYTAKVAGTEKGVTEPEATFSACFGAPFLPLPPGQYAELLGQKIAQHEVDVWLVNTGWTGGPYGVGNRMKISYTRAMVRAALSGYLASAPTKTDAIFGLPIPIRCPDVPDDVLNPRNTWPDKDAYDQQATRLATMFQENFKQFEAQVSPAVKAAGPLA
ncbi:MAG: phosphoenolpyruvate carboxykinase [Chloroflexota bacterium]